MSGKKLVYINIDGFSYSYWERMHAKKTDTVFEKLRRESLFFTNLHSGIISITNPMQSAILCGAWSEKTHNFYQHYDAEDNRIVKHYRTFDAENAAQAMLRNHKSAVSVHQFMLEDNPCRDGDEHAVYFRCGEEKSGYDKRFEILKNIALGNPVYSGGKKFVYDELPDFTALYIDDIDSLGHNNDYKQYPKRALFEERQQDIEERLQLIGKEIQEFISICKDRGFAQDLVLLVTTDHGMTPFWGKSSLPDLLCKLNRAGIAADLPENRSEDTQIVALPYTLEVSLYCVKPMTECQRKAVKQICENQEYTFKVIEKDELQSRYGMDSRGPDFLISPVYGRHFYHKDIPETTFAAGHDSMDETSQHTYGFLYGADVAKGDYDKPVYAIDLLPTILEKSFGISMKDSTGTVFEDWFKE